MVVLALHVGLMGQIGEILRFGAPKEMACLESAIGI